MPSRHVALINRQIQKLEEKKARAIARFDEAIGALRVLLVNADLLSPKFLEGMREKEPGETVQIPMPGFEDDDEDNESDSSGGIPGLRHQFTEGTLFERCLRFFLARKNAPATNAEIRNAIGSNRGSVAMVLYNTHPTAFEKVSVPEDHRMHWMLSSAGWDVAQRFKSEGSGQNDNSAK